MARLTRHQLKKDELAIRLAVIQEFFLEHQTLLAKTGGIVALAVAVAVGGYLLMRSRENRASSAFVAALATYHAPVSETPPEGSTGPHFKTAAEKYEEALKQFREVASSYSWTSQAKFARYYIGLSQRDLGKLPEAETELKEIAGGRNRDLGALAKLALAGIYENSGRREEAEKLYRELADRPTNTVPKATAELALADLYRRTKPAEATALYEKIQKDYAGMTAGDQASKALEAQAR